MSARPALRTNMDRTLLRHLCAPAIAPLVAADDLRQTSLDQPRWIRAYNTDTGTSFAGRIGADRAIRVQRRLVVECWCRLGTSQTEPVDGAQQIADEVEARLRFQRLQLLDLTTDPTGATSLRGWVRNLRPPRTLYASPVDGYAHRIVEADFDLVTQET